MEEIYRILKEIRPEFDYHMSNNYISDGILDSYDIIMLLSELQDTFNIVIDPMDVLPENFENADKIFALVNKNI